MGLRATCTSSLVSTTSLLSRLSDSVLVVSKSLSASCGSVLMAFSTWPLSFLKRRPIARLSGSASNEHHVISSPVTSIPSAPPCTFSSAAMYPRTLSMDARAAPSSF